jgi:hypothetical protein
MFKVYPTFQDRVKSTNIQSKAQRRQGIVSPKFGFPLEPYVSIEEAVSDHLQSNSSRVSFSHFLQSTDMISSLAETRLGPSQTSHGSPQAWKLIGQRLAIYKALPSRVIDASRMNDKNHMCSRIWLLILVLTNSKFLTLSAQLIRPSLEFSQRGSGES